MLVWGGYVGQYGTSGDSGSSCIEGYPPDESLRWNENTRVAVGREFPFPSHRIPIESPQEKEDSHSHGNPGNHCL